MLTLLLGLAVNGGEAEAAAKRAHPERRAVHAVRPPVAPRPAKPKPQVRSRTRHQGAQLRRKARLATPVRPLIVIDAGHGGRDGGAMGATGLLEKDVTLATALELQRQLRAQGRYRVVLTRAKDTAVSLSARIARARAPKPALFVSIHADASPDRRARGASVYVRADTASGAEITRLPASSANAGAIGQALSGGARSGGAGRHPAGSALLQYVMVEQLGNDIGLVRDPARQAHLYVLGTVGVPSVLVEMGFLSNPHEEHLLRSRRYRATISTAIRDAIGDYFKEAASRPAHRT